MTAIMEGDWMRTDAELMRAARKDAVAFGELYERYATRMLRVQPRAHVRSGCRVRSHRRDLRAGLAGTPPVS